MVTKEQIADAAIEMRKTWLSYCYAPSENDGDAVEHARYHMAENRLNDLVAIYLAEQAKQMKGA